MVGAMIVPKRYRKRLTLWLLKEDRSKKEG
jgi:hypothetical protein